MASMWARLRTEAEEKVPNCIAEIPEASLYYFVVKAENGKVLSEGELPRMKLKLPDEYFYKPYKYLSVDKTTLVATIQF